MSRSGAISPFQKIEESIQAKVDSSPDDYFLPKRCIFRVPKTTRDTNEQAFTPLVVSIGPYHYKDDKFCSMESYKFNYVKSFLSHTKDNANLNSYLKIINSNRSEISAFYVDPNIFFYSDEFTRMILMDSIFILELFRRYSDPSQIKDDLIILGSTTINQLLRDILLVENQLPFFILKELYSNAFGKQQTDQSLTDLACKAFGLSRNNVRVHSVSNEAMCCHLLDLFRSHYRPSDENGTKNYDMTNVTRTRHSVSPTASRLLEAGVRFQVAKTTSDSPSNLLDISFDEENGILTIPRLTMDQEPAHSIFRNIMAFEQSNYPFNTANYLLDYCYFLDCLIKTPEDVQLLVNVGIVEDYRLGCEVLCGMFDSVKDNVDRTATWSYYYAGISKMLASQCDKGKNHVDDDMVTLDVL